MPVSSKIFIFYLSIVLFCDVTLLNYEYSTSSGLGVGISRLSDTSPCLCRRNGTGITKNCPKSSRAFWLSGCGMYAVKAADAPGVFDRTRYNRQGITSRPAENNSSPCLSVGSNRIDFCPRYPTDTHLSVVPVGLSRAGFACCSICDYRMISGMCPGVTMR